MKIDAYQDHFLALKHQPISLILLFHRTELHSDQQQQVLYPMLNLEPEKVRKSIRDSNQDTAQATVEKGSHPVSIEPSLFVFLENSHLAEGIYTDA